MPEPIVTVHAQLRWLERIEEHDINAVRREIEARYDRLDESRLDIAVRDAILLSTGRTAGELDATILTEDRKAAIRAGANRIKLEDGGALTIVAGKVVTVLTKPKNGCLSRQARRKALRRKDRRAK